MWKQICGMMRTETVENREDKIIQIGQEIVDSIPLVVISMVALMDLSLSPS